MWMGEADPLPSLCVANSGRRSTTISTIEPGISMRGHLKPCCARGGGVQTMCNDLVLRLGRSDGNEIGPNVRTDTHINGRSDWSRELTNLFRWAPGRLAGGGQIHDSADAC